MCPSEGFLALFPLGQFPLPTAGAGHQRWWGIGIPPWSSKTGHCEGSNLCSLKSLPQSALNMSVLTPLPELKPLGVDGMLLHKKKECDSSRRWGSQGVQSHENPINWPLGIKPALLIGSGILCNQSSCVAVSSTGEGTGCVPSAGRELGTCSLTDLLLKMMPSDPKLPSNCPALWWVLSTQAPLGPRATLGLLTGVGMWFECGFKLPVHEKKWEADLQGGTL